MKKIYAAGHIPIIVGGTGFYIQALLYDIDFSQHEDKESYRKELEQLAKEKGKEYLYEILKKKDPEYAKITHCNNEIICSMCVDNSTDNNIDICLLVGLHTAFVQ